MKPASEMVDLTPPVTATARPESRALPDAATPSRAVDFYELTKPRMNFLVVITTMVGFLMASRSASVNWLLMTHALLGTAMCAASAAVLNQLMERGHDAKMLRTRNRPLPAGRMTVGEALVPGIAFGLVGVAYLAFAVNPLTAFLGAFTIISYLAIYTPAKRVTTLNTVIGAVPGAIPPVMGVTAASGAMTAEALTLFGILFFWQLPHFLAIAVMYRDDYIRGGFQMLPCVEADRSLPITGRMMVLYSVALIPVTLLPAMLDVAGVAYFAAALLMGLAFLSFAVTCATTGCARPEARKLFFASIIYLPLLLAALMLDKV